MGRYLLVTSTDGMLIQPNIESKLDCYDDADFEGL